MICLPRVGLCTYFNDRSCFAEIVMYLIVIIFTYIQFLCAAFDSTVVTVGLLSIKCCVIGVYSVCIVAVNNISLECCHDHFNRQF